jgi:hopanoid biosynthesis associated RND transporter like protein HpnN
MTSQQRIEHWLARWVDLMTRRAIWVVVLGALITLGGGWYSATHLTMDTNNADLISKRVGWRQDSVAYQKAFPIYVDNLAVVVDGATPDLASSAVKRLAKTLRSQPELFESVYVPGGGKFFARNGLLYLKPDKLNALANRLVRIQPLLGRLSTDPTLVTFFDLLGQAMAPDAPVQLSLSPVFGELADVFDANRRGHFDQMSWQGLIGGDQPGVSSQRFIIVKPRLDYDALLPAAAPMQAIRDGATKLHLDAAHGVRVRQTGEVALSDEELQSVTQGAAWGALAATLLVGIILYMGLRSWALMGASLASLVAGLVGTATFAALFVGRLNLISIAFAVLYIGLGIDYAIHVCLRYREAMLEQEGELAEHALAVRRALQTAISDVGVSLALCAFTTAAGFFAFIPTSYSGVAELGLISGVGMFISLVVSLTFLPAVLALIPEEIPRLCRGTPKV